MRIADLEITNFRSFKSLSLIPGKRLTLLLGENGAGKTNILDGIAVGLGAVATLLPEVKGISFKKDDLRQVKNEKAPFTRVKLTTEDGIVWDRTERKNKLPRRLLKNTRAVGLSNLKSYLEDLYEQLEMDQNEIDLPLFAYYGVSRAVMDVPLSRKGFPKNYHRYQALQGALEADIRFRAAFKWFYAKEQEELRLQRDKKNFEVYLPELQVVRMAIEQTFPGISNPQIETNPLRLVVEENGENLNITQLSDGYKTMLALIIDLASRMALANPHLGEGALKSKAMVMIDEIDLHLHPEWQRRVVSDLLRVFPNAQFFLTTHSPYIVESINNLLQQGHSYDKDKHKATQADLFAESAILEPRDIAAYLISEQELTSMMDEELGLLDNSLLDTFNNISEDFAKLQADN